MNNPGNFVFEAKSQVLDNKNITYNNNIGILEEEEKEEMFEFEDENQQQQFQQQQQNQQSSNRQNQRNQKKSNRKNNDQFQNNFNKDYEFQKLQQSNDINNAKQLLKFITEIQDYEVKIINQVIWQKEQELDQIGQHQVDNRDFWTEEEQLKVEQQIDSINDLISEKINIRTEFEKQTDKYLEQIQKSKNSLTQQQISFFIKQTKIEGNRIIQQLPIYSQRSKILKNIDKNQVTLLIGETGSGKSTQLVQYLYQHYQDTPNFQKILCVQPRKIAIRNVSQRVREEMLIEDENLIGCQASILDQYNEDNKIIFKQDRLVLDEMVEDRGLSKYTCVIIDEAHERNVNSDVLIGFIKEAIKVNKNLKVVITSATLDESLFVNYFNLKKNDVIKVSGRMFPVDIQYKDQTGNNYYNISPTQQIKTIICQEIFQKLDQQQYQGHILVFTEGLDQIQNLCEDFQKYIEKQNKQNTYEILPLHGRLEIAEQRKVFQQNGNKFKIIFCTRIAETAITIDGVKIIIDTGYDREQVYDPLKKMLVTQVNPITQSQAKQRAGRAGRTQPGICYRLYSQEFFNEMDQFKLAEILRMNLDNVVLKMKQLGINSIINFDYIQPPEDNILQASLESLIYLGALDDQTENITSLGQIMANLPTDPSISKIILEGILRNCEQDIIAIIGIYTFCGNLFRRGYEQFQKEQADKKKFSFCDESGDFLTFLEIFNVWKQLPDNLRDQQKFCKDNFLSLKALKQASDLIKEIKFSLKNIFQGKSISRQILNEFQQKSVIQINSENQQLSLKQNIIKCLLSAFFQNLCRYSGNPTLGYTLLNKNMNIKIHGQSSLQLQGINSKWIICSDLVQFETKNFCKTAMVVDIDMFQEMIPKKYLEKFNIVDLDRNPVYEQVTFKNVPNVIMQDIFRSIKDSKPGFNHDSSHIELLTDKQIIDIYTLEKEKIKTHMQNYIRDKKQEYFMQELQIDIVGDTSITVGAGFDVIQVNLKDQNLSFEINNYYQQQFEDLDIRNNRRQQNQYYLDYAIKKLRRFLQQQNLHYKNLIVNQELQTNIIQNGLRCQIDFDNYTNLQQCKQKLQMYYPGIDIKQIINKKKQNLNIIKTEVELIWYSGKSQGKAGIGYFKKNQDWEEQTQELLKLFKKYLIYSNNSNFNSMQVNSQIKNAYIPKSQSAKNQVTITLNKYIDDIELEKLILQAIKENESDEYSNIDCDIPDFIKVYRDQDFLYDSHEIQDWKDLISELILEFGTVEKEPIVYLGKHTAKDNYKNRVLFKSLYFPNILVQDENQEKYISQLDQFQEEYQDLIIQIYVSKKYLKIQGKLEDILELEQQINEFLENNNNIDSDDDLDQQDCEICQGNCLIPYCLIACEHTFCQGCLQECLNQNLKEQKLPLKCPDDSCQELIALQDIYFLSGERNHDTHQYTIALKSYKQYIMKNQNVYGNCISQDCDQVFYKNDGILEFSCDSCLKDQCKQCKLNAHPNKTCQQQNQFLIQQRDGLTDRQLEQYGIKKCPVCQLKIQKSDGCNHMICETDKGGCGAHLCWICLRYFNSEENCIYHLNQNHQERVFPDNYGEGFQIA